MSANALERKVEKDLGVAGRAEGLEVWKSSRRVAGVKHE